MVGFPAVRLLSWYSVEAFSGRHQRLTVVIRLLLGNCPWRLPRIWLTDSSSDCVLGGGVSAVVTLFYHGYPRWVLLSMPCSRGPLHPQNVWWSLTICWWGSARATIVCLFRAARLRCLPVRIKCSTLVWSTQIKLCAGYLKSACLPGQQ